MMAVDACCVLWLRVEEQQKNGLGGDIYMILEQVLEVSTNNTRERNEGKSVV